MEVCGIPLDVTKSFLSIARLQNEYYEFVQDPEVVIKSLKKQNIDLFSFIQEIPDPEPKFSYHLEWDSAAVITLSTYEHWWKKQINDKTRNMVRKAGKNGVEIREVSFNDDLVKAIVTIYNESPVRQGRPFRHFGKNFETISKEHATFLDRSQFFIAVHEGRTIGFIKLVHGRDISSLMNIISMIVHRDKAPTNALLAKAVEVCTTKGVPRLQYGTGNSRSIGDFKKHHAFAEVRVPRYYVPLNSKGSILLRLGLHRPLKERIPESLRERILDARTKWASRQAPVGRGPAPAKV